MKRSRQLWAAGVLTALLCMGVYGMAFSAEPEETAGGEPSGVTPGAQMVENPDPEVRREDWWTVPVFAHALGSVDGRAETNSLDAFLESYRAGHRVFEVDLQLTSDGHLVARHDWEQMSYYTLEQTYKGVMDYETFQNTPICYFYTPLDIEGIISLLQTYPDIYFVTDTKNTGEENVRAQLRALAAAVEGAGDETLWERIIIQIYQEEMYDWVAQEASVTNWIFTLYQLTEPDYEAIGRFCRDKGVQAVTVAAERINGTIAKTLHSYGCRVYVHTVDRLRAMQEMSWCVDGFYSNCVTPEELRTVLAGKSGMRLGAKG